MSFTLTKSEYLSGLQCHKMLWILKHDPSRLDTAGMSRLQRFQRGYEVGELACGLFPGGYRISYTEEDLAARCEHTIELMKGDCPAIYEATFEHQGLVVMVDILHRDPAGTGWEIHEVKSSTGVSEVYLEDLTFQYYVLTQTGVHITSAWLIYLNKEYTRGKEFNLRGLFHTLDLTESIKSRQKQIPPRITAMRQILTGAEPDIPIGTHCASPYECRAHSSCWASIPDYSVFQVSRLSGEEKFALYHQGKVRQSDLDLTGLSDKQAQEVQANLNREIVVNISALKQFLDQLRYPLYHLDFESFQQAIPEFQGIRVYQQIPFQYSLHIEYADGRLEHREYLAPTGSDPRPGLAARLVEDIPAGSMVLAYNATFERTVIKKLALAYPRLKKQLLAVQKNMVDLLDPFQKRMVYHYAQHGSNSIKDVLPAWVEDMEQAYADLKVVHNGSEAMSAYVSMAALQDPGEIESLRSRLLEYCRMDTLAMVRILARLRELVKD